MSGRRWAECRSDRSGATVRYVAPDWTADYLHRECAFYPQSNGRTAEFGKRRFIIPNEQKARLRQRLQDLMRTNTYDAGDREDHHRSDPRPGVRGKSQALHEVFTNGNKDYAIQRDAQSDPAKLRQMNSFFFWTAWASAANRPDNTISYTSNFPSEPLVGNVSDKSARSSGPASA